MVLKCSSEDISLRTLVLWLLLASLFATGTSSYCPWPCITSSCEQLGDCEHGVVPDRCYCCEVCGRGEGELCSDLEGRCGDGLECVKDLPTGLTALDIRQYPGVCAVKTTTVRPTTTSTTAPRSTTTVQPTMTTEAIVKCAQLGFEPVKEARSTIQPPCRQECSVDYCSDANRHRLCSAKGMTFSHVSSRGTCQHTSCRACFLHIEPVCGDTTCSDPPQKQCLRPYYQCIRNQVLGVQSNSISSPPSILSLDDPAAKNFSGRIICYVAEVTESTEST